MIIGIDGGSKKTGICIVDNSKVVYHKTCDALTAIDLVEKLHTVYRFERAVVELPSNSVLYSKKVKRMSAGISRKIMCNVGENRQCAKLISEKMRRLGVSVLEKKPVAGMTKWDCEYWCRVFNFTGKPPSEHARDAGVLALRWETWYGWNNFEQFNK